MCKRLIVILYISLITCPSILTSKWCPLGKVYINGVCRKCPDCPKGFGLKKDCLAHIISEFDPECQPCPNNTFSSSKSHSACKNCRLPCGLNEIEKTVCTRESDRECICKKEFKMDPATGLCIRKCCQCKTGRITERAEECKHMPGGKKCFCNQLIHSSKSVRIATTTNRSKYTLLRSLSATPAYVSKSILLPSLSSSTTSVVTPKKWKTVLSSVSPTLLISPTKSTHTSYSSSLIRPMDHRKLEKDKAAHVGTIVMFTFSFLIAVVIFISFAYVTVRRRSYTFHFINNGKSKVEGWTNEVEIDEEVSATDRLLQTGPSLATNVHYRDKGHVVPAQTLTIEEFYENFGNLSGLSKLLELNKGYKKLGYKLAEIYYAGDIEKQRELTKAIDQLEPDSAKNLLEAWAAQTPEKNIGKIKEKATSLGRKDIILFIRHKNLPESLPLKEMQLEDKDELIALLNKYVLWDWRSFAEDDFKTSDIERLKVTNSPSHLYTVEFFKLIKQRIPGLRLEVVCTAAKEIGRPDVEKFLTAKMNP
ncbi:uncharacterized protein LOC130645447 isoform X2 [Hydractinia symbiolongicarpus]|uniref:uncharacterized protein LOC130645447 isoform X2 n=1 Tax=Hydractinia symbiolongicarpus TaxID=13093 RepID=UPI00254F42A9|nr:uncharacterized protein LOC130645447 isoform X2 [Hydractinia symbiolongicarpus]